jgi:non-ribosomal peptide synthetase component F
LRLSLFTILLGSFQLLVARYIGREDVIVATPTTGRRGNPEIELVIGPFGSFLPIRADLSGKSSYTQVLTRVRETTLRAQMYQAGPFERLVPELKIKQGSLCNPLLQFVF